MTEKQMIKKMKKDIGDTWIVDLDGNVKDLTEVLWDADIENIAIELYNIGYRKQSEGEWKHPTEPLGAHDVVCAMCSVCGDEWILDEEFDFDTVVDLWHYCPHCGARMKGGE